MYWHARDAFLSAGYGQATRHSFEMPGRRYQYEFHYSLGTPLLGLGANSISYVPEFIYKNVSELDAYASAIRKGELPAQSGLDLAASGEEANNYMVKRLTYLSVDKADFRRRFGQDIEHLYPEQTEALVEAGLVETDSEELRLTETGIYYTALVKRCFFGQWVHEEKAKRVGNAAPPERERQPRSSTVG
ncbi:MAG: hypothetical protein ACYTKD_26815 [Planctomycetota bacterium]